MERLLVNYSNVLEVESNRRCVCDGHGRRYLARDPKDLWDRSPHLLDEKLYKKMPLGWYANTNLDEMTKLLVIRRFCKVVGLEEGKDWTWSVV